MPAPRPESVVVASAADADEGLMLAYAAGDAAAFDSLYARHKGGVYRYLLRHCGRAATADELFQDVWMNVIRVRASYAPTARFATWLYRIAHNRLVDHWRSTASQHGFVGNSNASPTTDGDDDAEDPIDHVPAPRTDQPEVRADAREAAARIARALAALPPAQRDAFLLHQEAGLSLAEIAAMTDEGVETIKSRVRYALGRLRTELGDLR